MIAKFLRYAGLAGLALVLSAHKSSEEGDTGPASMRPRIVIQEVNPWTHLEMNNDPDRFQFAIVSDRTGGHRPGIFEDAVTKLNLLQPEFVMSVGDLIEGYSEDVALIQSQWVEFEGFVEELEMPFFFVPGNHDLSNEVQVEEWKRRFGRPYYHFVYRDVLFICLDSEDPPPTHISEEQIEYVAQALEENPDVRWTLAFLHKPLWVYEEDTGWSQIEAMLKERKHTIIAGHLHTYTKYERNDTNYFILATTGGGSSLRGPLFGQFDHVVWITMTDAGPRVANLMLEGIWDENVRTEGVATMVDALLWGGAIAPMPIFTGKREFKGGATQLRLTNDADMPMQVVGTFQPHPGLEVRPAEIEVTVPPNSVERVDLEVKPFKKKLKVDEIQPVTMDWKVTYELEEGEPIELDGSARVVVERQFDCARRKEKVVVDGNLDEWKKLPFVCREPAQIRVAPDSWKGADDCAFRFGVEHDDEYLYIAVEVTDERSILDPDRTPWSQDGIEVRVDARPDPVRSNSQGQGENANFMFVGMSPGETLAEMVYYQRDQVEQQGVEAICVKTATGFNTEIAIPRAYMNEKQGEEWQAFRLNIAVDDYDEPTGPLAQLWWRPDWRYPENYPGSGTFRRR